MSLAFLFPGQGSQAVGMGRALYDTFPESRAVFELADAALGEQLSRLCFEGPEADLMLTANTQPAMLVTSLAANAALARSGIQPDFVAGHSLGEYTATVAAGALGVAEAVVAVRRRGAYMQEAVPVGVGAMAAILMLELEAVEDACREVAQGDVVTAANLNAPGQIVIAGHAAAVERAMEACRKRGAKRAIKLPVSAPFHCALMRPAQARMAQDLAQLRFAHPKLPVVNNVDAAPVRDGDACREGLVRQVSAPVRWQASIERMLHDGVTTFVEVGPGTVLSGLVKKISKTSRVLNVADPQSLELALTVLRASAKA